MFKIINSRAQYSRQKNNTNTDHLKRILFLKYEVVKLILKTILRNNYVSNNCKLPIILFLNKHSKFAFRTKFINYCTVRGRKYSVSYKYKMSRYVIFSNLSNVKFLQN